MAANFGRKGSVAHRLSRPLVALLTLAVAAANADVRNVTISSEPGAATVYLLKGFKREKIGETPLEHAFAVRSTQSVVRLEIVKPGYETKNLEIGGNNDRVAAVLTPIPPFREPGSYADDSLRAIASGLERQSPEAWRDALAMLEPWGPDTPAYLERRGASVFLVVELGNAGERGPGGDINAAAGRFAAELPAGKTFDRLSAAILSFKASRAGGVQTSVGTRLETDMVCEGGMVMSSVWDNCATRSATTSSTSYGTSVQYRCVGGTVTRQTFNPCARRVPKQRAVVDIRSKPRTAMDLNASNVIVDIAARKVLGSCRYVNGVRKQVAGAAEDARVQQACPAAGSL